MAMMSAGGGPQFRAFSVGGGNVPMRIKFDFFFDRKSVQDALDKATHRALQSAGSVVMQISRRSIKKMGLAKPALREMKSSPGFSLTQLLSRNDISDKRKNKIRQRLWEIKSKEASRPGTPPHTHTGALRNSIVYAYDPSSESVIVGSYMAGAAYIASIHEHGGRQTMQAWAWIPRFPRANKGILAWYPPGRGPKNQRNWARTNFRETFPYPARPFVFPALMEGINRGRIAASFANKFRSG